MQNCAAHMNYPLQIMHFLLFVSDWLAMKKVNTIFKDYTKEELAATLH